VRLSLSLPSNVIVLASALALGANSVAAGSPWMQEAALAATDESSFSLVGDSPEYAAFN